MPLQDELSYNARHFINRKYCTSFKTASPNKYNQGNNQSHFVFIHLVYKQPIIIQYSTINGGVTNHIFEFIILAGKSHNIMS